LKKQTIKSRKSFAELEQYLSCLQEIDKGLKKMLFKTRTNANILEVNDAVKESIKNKKNLYRLAQIVEYIKENRKTDLSLDMVTEEFNLTPQYLSKYFNKYIGISYIKYLNTLRLESAYKDLVSTAYQ
jgi:YesN/AraC family two-component response regulator